MLPEKITINLLNLLNLLNLRASHVARGEENKC